MNILPSKCFDFSSHDNKIDNKNYYYFISFVNYLREKRQFEQALQLLDQVENSGVKNFPDVYIDYLKIKVETLFELKRYEDAFEYIGYVVKKPYMLGNTNDLGLFLYLQILKNIEENNTSDIRYYIYSLLFSGAGIGNTNIERIFHNNDKDVFCDTYNIPYIIRCILKVFLKKNKNIFYFVLSKILIIAYVQASRFFIKSDKSLLKKRFYDKDIVAKKAILVTRVMGGIGDIIMMTVGLGKLKKKFPNHEIHFAIHSKYHTLLQGMSGVVVKDIYSEDFYYEDYEFVYNLSQCPAAKIESRTIPNVKRSRIEIFTGYMGINLKKFADVDYIPIYTISDEEKKFAENFFLQHSLQSEECIAVQPFAADSYKDYPHIKELVKLISKTKKVLVFHNEPLHDFSGENIFVLDNLPLRKSIALMAQCKKLVAIDSSFVHIAGALSIPTIALFGPTDGKIFTKHYPQCRVVDGYSKMRCKACWRNQSIMCEKNKTTVSACLESILPNEILPKIED